MGDKPWTRRDDETDAAWQAFRIFRDLGLSRTIEEAWNQYADERDLKSDMAPRHFHDWKDEYDWYDRVRKYDAYVDEQRRAQITEARQESIRVLAEKAVPSAAILALLAVNADPGDLDLEDLEELGDLEDVDGHQKWAIDQLLDRVGVTSPDQLEVSGEVEKDRMGLDLEMFRDFLDMDDDEREQRIDNLDAMREELEDDDD